MQLLTLALRPSEVVSRDYATTRSWARRLYDQHRWVGVKWWSYYNRAWSSIALWDIGTLRLETVRPLRLGDKDVPEAGNTIVRSVIRRSSGV